jgi:hypothetical protein
LSGFNVGLIYIYGTWVLIGFAGPQEMVYIHHMLKDGANEIILTRQ